MSGIDNKTRRRVLWFGAPFAVGALVGAAVIAGIGGTSSSSLAASSAGGGGTASSSEVIKTTPQYNAQTIYKRDSAGVVDITVTEAASQGGGGLSPFVPGNGSQQAEGTGFVYNKSGDIVTADHVVSGTTKISVRFSDGTTAKATLVGADPSSDTAVIHVSVPAAQLTPLTLANSAAVEPGEGVVAIGSPFGYADTITAGIVSAVGRDIQAPNGYSIPNAIQTDAAINHGNSGGPLIDTSGDVVGINDQIVTDSQSSDSNNAGVGFAVPSNSVKAVASDLIAGRSVQHPYIGVAVGDSTSGSGALVGTVRAGSPAASAGLKVGDVITAVDGKGIADASELTAAVSEHQPGATLHLTVERSGATLQIPITLGVRPATTTA